MKSVPWALRSKERFVAVVTSTWAVLGLAALVVLQISNGDSVHFVESAFGFLGGAIGGLFWSLLMWELGLKSRIQLILSREAEATNAEV